MDVNDDRSQPTHDAVIEGVADPIEEGDWGEEIVLLAQLVELGIAVEHPSRHELIKDANDEGREDGEDDVVK